MATYMRPELDYDFNHNEDAYCCGNCNRRVFPNYRHCSDCGEAMDWVEMENE